GSREQASETVGGGVDTRQVDPKGSLGGKLLSPTRRRRAVAQVREKLTVSERRACEVLGQPRSTQRYAVQEDESEKQLVKRMLELVREHPRFGYRRITSLLRQEGWKVNRKRVYRLWVAEGLKVPRKVRKKRATGTAASGCVRRRAEHKDHVWTW